MSQESVSRQFFEQFRCLPCHPTCHSHNLSCASARSCKLKLNWGLIGFCMFINVVAALACIGTAIVVVVHRQQAVIRASSWKFLFFVLVGEAISFSSVNLYASQTDIICLVVGYLIHTSFLLTHASFYIKLWRLKLLRSKNVVRRQEKVDDVYLAKRLIAIVLVFSLVYGIWIGGRLLQAVSETTTYVGDTADGPVYFDICSSNRPIIVIAFCKYCFTHFSHTLHMPCFSPDISFFLFFPPPKGPVAKNCRCSTNRRTSKVFFFLGGGRGGEGLSLRLQVV